MPVLHFPIGGTIHNHLSQVWIWNCATWTKHSPLWFTTRSNEATFASYAVNTNTIWFLNLILRNDCQFASDEIWSVCSDSTVNINISCYSNDVRNFALNYWEYSSHCWETENWKYFLRLCLSLNSAEVLARHIQYSMRWEHDQHLY